MDHSTFSFGDLSTSFDYEPNPTTTRPHNTRCNTNDPEEETPSGDEGEGGPNDFRSCDDNGDNCELYQHTEEQTLDANGLADDSMFDLSAMFQAPTTRATTKNKTQPQQQPQPTLPTKPAPTTTTTTTSSSTPHNRPSPNDPHTSPSSPTATTQHYKQQQQQQQPQQDLYTTPTIALTAQTTSPTQYTTTTTIKPTPPQPAGGSAPASSITKRRELAKQQHQQQQQQQQQRQEQNELSSTNKSALPREKQFSPQYDPEASPQPQKPAPSDPQQTRGARQEQQQQQQQINQKSTTPTTTTTTTPPLPTITEPLSTTKERLIQLQQQIQRHLVEVKTWCYQQSAHNTDLHNQLHAQQDKYQQTSQQYTHELGHWAQRFTQAKINENTFRTTLSQIQQEIDVVHQQDQWLQDELIRTKQSIAQLEGEKRFLETQLSQKKRLMQQQLESSQRLLNRYQHFLGLEIEQITATAATMASGVGGYNQQHYQQHQEDEQSYDCLRIRYTHLEPELSFYLQLEPTIQVRGMNLSLPGYERLSQAFERSGKLREFFVQLYFLHQQIYPRVHHHPHFAQNGAMMQNNNQLMQGQRQHQQQQQQQPQQYQHHQPNTQQQQRDQYQHNPFDDHFNQ